MYNLPTMRFEDVVAATPKRGVISIEALRAMDDSPSLPSKLCRWVKQGKLMRIKRGLYAPKPPYADFPDSFLVANAYFGPNSYISSYSVMSLLSIIPERVPVAISSVVGRSTKDNIVTPTCRLQACHIPEDMFWGYETLELSEGVYLRTATPEKALLDLIYQAHDAGRKGFLEHLRLQGLDEELDQPRLMRMAERTKRPFLVRMAKEVVEMAKAEAEMWHDL